MFTTPGQNGPFPTNVSAYFRRPSKVVKSSSRTNSPRNTGRRRMTTTGNYPARTRSVVDHQRASMPQLSQYQPTSNRPISWHPNMMEEVAYLQMMPQHTGESNLNSPYPTIEMDGLVTPMSFPVMDEPQIQELISPLEELSAHDPSTTYNLGQDFSMETWLNQQQMKSLPNFGANMYPDNAYPTWYTYDQYTTPAMMPTSSVSPDYLPMPELDAPFPHDLENLESGKDELVGMGLYDSPADVQTSSLLFGNGFGTYIRKTLKLEDAFEPAPVSDEDEDDDEDDDDDEDEDAPGEPDDMISTIPDTSVVAVSSNDRISSGIIPYSLSSESDLLRVPQWI